MSFKVTSVLIGATFKERNMLPMWSIFFPLIVTHFEAWILLYRSKVFLTIQIHVAYTKKVCPFIAYCVTEFETVFRNFIFWHFFVFTASSAK